MAESKKGTYLTLYDADVYGRQGAGLKGNFPDGQNPGLQAGNAIIGGAREVGNPALGHAMQAFSQVYDNVILERNMLDETVRAESWFRERQLRDSQLKGADADHLFYKNHADLAEDRDAFLRSSSLSPRLAADVYNKQAQGYLNWSMTYMQQQAVVASKEVKAKKAKSLVTQASNSPMSIESLKNIHETAAALYGAGTPEYNETAGQATDALMRAAAANSPDEFMYWVKQEAKRLRDTMGEDGAKAFEKKALELSKTSKMALVQHAVATENLKAAERTRRGAKLNDAVYAMVLTGDPIDPNKIAEYGMSIGAPTQEIYKALELGYKAAENQATRDSDRRVTSYLNLGRELTPEENLEVQTAYANGSITKTTMELISANNGLAKEATKGERSEQYALAKGYITSAVKGHKMNSSGAMDGQIQRMSQRYLKAVDGLTQKELILASDLDDPNSLLSKIVRQGLADMDEQGFSLYPEPTGPGEATASKVKALQSKGLSKEQILEQMGY